MTATPLTLFHVSDLHFGSEDSAALAWFMAEVEREAPDAVLCTGDFTMRGISREFDMARAWLEQLQVPIAMVPGNHDVPYYNHLIRRLTKPYDRYRQMAGGFGPALELPGLAVVPLKTIARAQFRLNWSKGRVSQKDLDAALGGLERWRDKPLRIVLGHHPLVDADTDNSGSTRGGKRALRALARAGAQVVLSGHVHDPFDITVEPEPGRPLRLIGAGTLSERLRETPPSYNRLDWDGAGDLKVTAVRHLQAAATAS